MESQKIVIALLVALIGVSLVQISLVITNIENQASYMRMLQQEANSEYHEDQQKTSSPLQTPLSGKEPLHLVLDQACFERNPDSGEVVGLHEGCTNFGEVQIDSALRAKILPVPSDMTTVEIAFFSGSDEWIPRLTLSSYININEELFFVEIIGAHGSWMYVQAYGGHESFPAYYVYGPNGWNAFDPWEIVKDVFPDSMIPPFSFELNLQDYNSDKKSADFILTEETYCCDTVYSEDRSTYRMQYLLNLTGDNGEIPTYEIVETRKIAR